MKFCGIISDDVEEYTVSWNELNRLKSEWFESVEKKSSSKIRLFLSEVGLACICPNDRVRNIKRVTYLLHTGTESRRLPESRLGRWKSSEKGSGSK